MRKDARGPELSEATNSIKKDKKKLSVTGALLLPRGRGREIEKESRSSEAPQTKKGDGNRKKKLRAGWTEMCGEGATKPMR